MTEYICKCGRKLQRSTNGATTGLKLDGYAPGHECFGCPYVTPINSWADGGMQLDHYECIASKELHYDTYACTSCFENDSKVGHILSLDWDFLRRVAAECDKYPQHISINRENSGGMFGYKSKYREDGRFDFCIYPTQNKAGAKAKRAIFEKFFTPSGRRKDMTLEQEKEKILNDIKTGRSNELPQPYKPGDIYIDPVDHSRMRVVDITPDKKERAWQVQEDDGSGWESANSSVYPHFEDAVRTLAAFVRSYDLVPEYEEEPTCPEPVETALPTASAPACPAASGTAEPALPAPSPAPLAAASTMDMADRPSFDYSVLDAETSYRLQGITQCVVQLQTDFAWGMAYQVGQAHELLCGACDTVSQAQRRNNQHSEATFTAWCEYVGIERRTSYRLLNAYRLIRQATPEQQLNLQRAPASLLYAAGQKDAPEQLVQQVLDGDIHNRKEYQEAMARIKKLEADADCDALTKKLLRESADAAKLEAEQLASEAERERKAKEHMCDVAGEYKKERDEARQQLIEAERKVAKLESMPPATVEATMVDEDELNRRAQALADRQTAALRHDLDAANRLNAKLNHRIEQLTPDKTDHLRTLSEQAAAACRNAEAVLAAWLETLRSEPDEVYNAVSAPAREFADRIRDAVLYGSFEAPASYHKEDVPDV